MLICFYICHLFKLSNSGVSSVDIEAATRRRVVHQEARLQWLLDWNLLEQEGVQSEFCSVTPVPESGSAPEPQPEAAPAQALALT